MLDLHSCSMKKGKILMPDPEVKSDTRPPGSRRPLRVEALVTELPVPGQATVSKPPLTLVLAIDYEGYSVWNETVTSHYRCCQHLSTGPLVSLFFFHFLLFTRGTHGCGDKVTERGSDNTTRGSSSWLARPRCTTLGE